jgi:hypothetical protein
MRHGELKIAAHLLSFAALLSAFNTQVVAGVLLDATQPAATQPDSPQAAITEFYGAWESLNLNAAIGRSVVPEADTTLFKAGFELYSPMKRILDLAEPRFGKSPDIGIGRANIATRILATAQFKRDGDTAEFVTPGKTFRVVKIAGFWKVDLTHEPIFDPQFEDPGDLTRGLTAEKTAMSKVADRLAAGVYTTPEQLRLAVEDAIDASLNISH